ncbi:MAG: endonuclease III [Dehalococcoidia bacterium]|nr:endonuclease III [Dehalococcoidia bacterium]
MNNESCYNISDLLTTLDRYYNLAPQQISNAPLFELVLTLLSQHTSDHNSGRAMNQLINRFNSWEEIINAPLQNIENAIRPGGLAPTKSKRLQKLLIEVKKRQPNLNLDFLKDMPLTEAKEWLTSLPGVGPKTAACVLLFALNRPALPVDTHVGRVSKRLGLASNKLSNDDLHDVLEKKVKPEQIYLFHMSLIQHGRRVCHSRKPECPRCPLLKNCPQIDVSID